MKVYCTKIGQSSTTAFDIAGPQVRIGRNPTSNDIVLDSPFVADCAAVLSRVDG